MCYEGIVFDLGFYNRIDVHLFNFHRHQILFHEVLSVIALFLSNHKNRTTLYDGKGFGNVKINVVNYSSSNAALVSLDKDLYCSKDLSSKLRLLVSSY